VHGTKGYNKKYNQVVATRLKFPDAHIYGVKIDFKSDYRHMHLAFEIALRSTLQLEEEEEIYCSRHKIFHC
jgi:hypothetical protein